jgi:hypothetical protein
MNRPSPNRVIFNLIAHDAHFIGLDKSATLGLQLEVLVLFDLAFLSLSIFSEPVEVYWV